MKVYLVVVLRETCLTVMVDELERTNRYRKM